MKVICPDCQSGNYKCIGKIASDQLFAGRIIKNLSQETFLYKCGECYLKYKYPREDINFYNSLYDNDSAETWDQSSQRYDQLIVLDYLNALEKKNILDYGCYTGGFLSKLKKDHNLFGVEINEKAANIAHEQSGASVFTNIENLPQNQLFDVIVSMDVIEHMVSPKLFIEKLLQFVPVGGEIIISTGDSENFLWKLHPLNWWYSSFNEHISFISESWLRHYSSVLNFDIVSIDRYSYEKRSMISYLKYIARILLLSLNIKEGIVKKFLIPNFKSNYIGLGVSNDHILIRVRKHS